MNRQAPAKINLGLRIFEKRSDGYHNIETVFVRIGWHDTLQFQPGEVLSFECSDPTLPVDESNLVVRAIREFEKWSGTPIVGQFTLRKELPFGAGLGGGSSDAAAALLLCSSIAAEMAGEGTLIEQPELFKIAESLGADVPFFLTHGVQVGTGTGTQLRSMRSASGESYRLPFHVVVVAPDVFVSSALAYKSIAPRIKSKGERSVGELVQTNDPELWRKELVNDFEPSVFDAFPQIRRTRDQLLESGAKYASLSGSGSAVFGLYETSEGAMEACNSLLTVVPGGFRTWVGKPLNGVGNDTD